MNEVNTGLIDAYLNGEAATDLPDMKALQEDTTTIVGRTAAVKQALALISDNAKAQAELDEAEGVLREATTVEELVVEAKSSGSALIPVLILAAVTGSIVLIGGLAF